MPKPHAEHSSTIKAKKRTVVDSDRVQPVQGGSVRRIVFEGREPEPQPARRVVTRSEREWAPRHRASIDDIHFEVDHLGRVRRRTSRERRPASESRGDRPEVHPVAVDKVIARRIRREQTVEEEPAREVTATKTQRKKRRTKSKRTKAKKGATKPKATAEPAGRSAKTRGATPAEPEYQPQCLAVTSGAKQCRNSAKGGSKYCGVHQGFTAAKAAKILDTKPARATEDTKPGQKGSQATAQCAAYTQSGVQCRRSSRKTSKYCGVHKNYRAPTKAQLGDRLDTKPRHGKAKDTKPSV